MVSSETKIVGLIGNPVEHSVSPDMHNAAFKELGLDYVYLAFKVEEKFVEEAIDGLKGLEMEGVNVTIPHKSAVMAHLDELDKTARQIGAVNTIKRIDHKLKGFNTDGKGALRALRENFESLKDKNVTLLGAGGAARAISFALAEAGANLKISNRTTSKAEKLIEEIGDKTGNKPALVHQEEEDLKKAVESCEILINSTSVGMAPEEDATLIEAEQMHSDLTVMDIVYNPLETKLLKEAEKAGAETINGLNMLVRQGATSFEIWTGEKAPVKVMEEATKRAMKGKI